MMINSQRGFTLVEALITVSLGLLIIAAGFAVFLSGQRSIVLQNGMGELQQNANFGLATLAQDIRHANLNTVSKQLITSNTAGSGIIFSEKNLPASFAGSSLDYLFTAHEQDDSATTIKSDRLTIQYVPEYNKITSQEEYEEDGETKTRDITTYSFNGIDCEGNALEFDQPRVIVQRYHLKLDTYQVEGTPSAYSLYCDAGSYVEGDSVITGISDDKDGQQLMQKIDLFKVRLGLKDKSGKMRYANIADYLTLMPVASTDTTPQYNIQSVEISLLARSTTPVTSEDLIKNDRDFRINDVDVKLSKVHIDGPKYIREVFNQVVAFRNTFGASL